MFDPGGVLHASRRAALRRSHECFLTGCCAIARGVVPRHFGLVYPERKELDPKGSVQASPG